MITKKADKKSTKKKNYSHSILLRALAITIRTKGERLQLGTNSREWSDIIGLLYLKLTYLRKIVIDL